MKSTFVSVTLPVFSTLKSYRIISFGLNPVIPFSITVYVFSTAIDGASVVVIETDPDPKVSLSAIGELAVTLAVFIISPESAPSESIVYVA